MKRIVLTILATYLIFSFSIGQNSPLELTFTGIEDSSYTVLDSIHIRNISKGLDTTLFHPDTVLLLDYWTGIPTNEASTRELTVIQNFPNPVIDETTIKISVPNDGIFYISISDIMGKVILRDEYKLNQGFHLFSFQPGESSCYFLAITDGISYSSIKITTAKKQGLLNFEYSGSSDGIILKRSQSSNEYPFQYTIGDTLVYEGYSLTTSDILGSDVLFDSPETSIDYIFQISNGIPCPDASLIIHESGNDIYFYSTLQIGDQCWMKENYESIVGGWCYENNPENCEVYGRLYSWDWIMNNEPSSNLIPSGVQGRCPDGWHLPSLGEWEILFNFLGGAEVAGGKLKEAGTLHWESPNLGATNESGFSALPGGLRFDAGYPFGWVFSNLESTAYFWTTTIGENIGLPTMISLWDFYSSAGITWGNSNSCASVRCIKD